MSKTSSLDNVTNIRSRMLFRNKPFTQKLLTYSHPQRPTNTSDFQAMCESIMNMVIGSKWMYLSFSCKASESSGENNLVMVRMER